MILHATIGVLIALPILAEAQDAPAFEVASVKLTQHGRDKDGWSRSSLNITSPGRFVATNASMEECIRFAYDVKAYQIVGPDWLNSDAASYDIIATASRETSSQQIRLMLQSLLAERFRLAVHRETRVLPVYELVVGKNGPRLTPAAPGGRSMTNSKNGTVSATNVSMAELAHQLSRTSAIGRPVFDKTGIEGAFDFTYEYTPDDNDSAGRPSIFTALQQKLGLKLEAAKGPVEVVVIDHAEKVPTAN
jgi:uncharacterized protein (TIGR03435 family)